MQPLHALKLPFFVSYLTNAIVKTGIGTRESRVHTARLDRPDPECRVSRGHDSSARTHARVPWVRGSRRTAEPRGSIRRPRRIPARSHARTIDAATGQPEGGAENEGSHVPPPQVCIAVLRLDVRFTRPRGIQRSSAEHTSVGDHLRVEDGARRKRRATVHQHGMGE